MKILWDNPKQIWDYTERWVSQVENTQTVTGKEQWTSTNSIIANDKTKTKQEGHLVADVHKGQRKVQCWTTHTFRTWDFEEQNKKWNV